MEFSFSIGRSKRSQVSDVKNPEPWFLSAMGGDASGVTVNYKTALSYSAWWRGVTLISSLIGSLPFGIQEIKANGKFAAKDHPQNILIAKRSNSYMTSQQFRTVMEMSRLNRGNGYALIKRNESSGFAEELQFLDPSKVEPFLSDGKKYFRISGRANVVEDMNMIHIMGPSINGVKGLNMIEYHRETIGLGLQAKNFQNKFYKQGGFMKGFLKVAGKLADGKPKELSEDFDKNWSGPENMFKTPVLQSGAEYIRVSLPQRDAQTMEQARFSIEDVARILGVPAHKLMENVQTSYSSQEQENMQFVQDNLRVRAKEWEAEYDYKILLYNPRYETRMNLEGLLRADTRTRMEKYRVMWNSGSINADQIREFEGMNPRDNDEGKKYYEPMNMISEEARDLEQKQKEKDLKNG